VIVNCKDGQLIEDGASLLRGFFDRQVVNDEHQVDENCEVECEDEKYREFAQVANHNCNHKSAQKVKQYC